jgi:hypothetical protein
MKTSIRVCIFLSVAGMFAGAAAAADAAHAGQVCRPFKQGDKSYRWETIGTRWTCASAKPWVVKLIGDHIRKASTDVTLTNGPGGYHCYAQPTSTRGHATDGTCFKGTRAYPKSGFAWFEA